MPSRSPRTRFRIAVSKLAAVARMVFEATMFGPEAARAARHKRSSAMPALAQRAPARTRRIVPVLVALAVAALVAVSSGVTPAHATIAPATGNRPPVKVSVLAPRLQDTAGKDGAGFVVDVALTARNRGANDTLSAGAGYRPFFNDPTAPTFMPGTNMGAPGLVVLLSTTPDTAGSPFHGPRTNLAGLFQINGVGTVKGGLNQTRNVWQIGKAGFGSGAAMLTVFAVRGTAPAVVPESGLDIISNTVAVPFTITAPPATAVAAPQTLEIAHNVALGDILVDSAGRTVYLFEKDQGTTTACTGACTGTWPALTAGTTPTTGTGLDPSMIGSVDGHVSYAGHLLYHYAGDAQPGDTLGAGIPSWAAVSPAGNAIRPN